MLRVMIPLIFTLEVFWIVDDRVNNANIFFLRFTSPRFTSPRFTSPVQSSPVREIQYATETTEKRWKRIRIEESDSD